MNLDKIEIIYYELAKMEASITEKAKLVFEAEEKISKALNRFEILQKELIGKMENKWILEWEFTMHIMKQKFM